MPSFNDYAFVDICEGMTVSNDYRIDRTVYEPFLAAFADRSSIHVDDDYAQALGFQGRVMHGAILNGFLSHFIGMHFPGRRALLLSSDIRYSKPSYFGDAIQLQSTVSQKVESQRVLVLDVIFRNQTQGIVVARGRVQVAVRDE